MKELFCLRCNSEMCFMKSEKIQLGQTGWFLGDLPNLLAGAMEMDIYCCPHCGKVEFFQSETQSTSHSNHIAQKNCPRCGKTHDIDYPKCPFCKFGYYAE